MFGPELSFSMYKCYFLACFCSSRRVQRLSTELILAVTDGPVANHKPIATKLDTRMQIRPNLIDMESRLDRQLDGPSHMHRPICCVCR